MVFQLCCCCFKWEKWDRVMAVPKLTQFISSAVRIWTQVKNKQSKVLVLTSLWWNCSLDSETCKHLLNNSTHSIYYSGGREIYVRKSNKKGTALTSWLGPACPDIEISSRASHQGLRNLGHSCLGDVMIPPACVVTLCSRKAPECWLISLGMHKSGGASIQYITHLTWCK